MKKFIKNNNGSMILLSGIILILAMISMDMIFYPEDIDDINTNTPNVQKTGWGLIFSFFDMIFDSIDKLSQILTFNSQILIQLGLIGTIIGLIIWALILIGLIDILWIG